MFELSESQIMRTTSVGNMLTAFSVSTSCPYCGERVIFSLGAYIQDGTRGCVPSTGHCPSCRSEAHFWTIKNPLANGGDQPDYRYYMFPRPKSGYPIPALPENVPEPLQRAFRSTIDSLNTRNFPATAVCARRTLEGIFKYLVAKDDREKSLYVLIDQVKKNNDLAAPLETLSHAIRSGGNLGAHFDDENEPTEAMAHRMVELLDYLISYLYVLPSQITDLEKQLGKE